MPLVNKLYESKCPCTSTAVAAVKFAAALLIIKLKVNISTAHLFDHSSTIEHKNLVLHFCCPEEATLQLLVKIIFELHVCTIRAKKIGGLVTQLL